MRLSTLLALPAGLAASLLTSTRSSNDYSEHLHLKPLPNRALYAGFNFTAWIPGDAYDNQNYRFFPRSVGQILQFTHASELHLRFALGRWDEESWGSRPRNGRREGGTGVELWAWLEAESKDEAEIRWSDLVNSLSGLFCASLNFIDQTKTTNPILAFEPEGTTDHAAKKKRHLMHGMLPNEVVCTENLTPLLKLLPCKGKAGVSSLLDGHKVFDANWQTMAIDVRPICDDTGSCGLEIEQTVDMVLDLDRSMRPRDDPIPRPLPIEETPCDESKSYNSHDTCYPRRRENEPQWSLSRVFGRSIQGSCPVGNRDGTTDVYLEVPAHRDVTTLPGDGYENMALTEQARLYSLKTGQAFDIELPPQSVEHISQPAQVGLRAERQITGYGQERGGMHTVIVNPHDYAQRVVYLESLPWFLRPYMHTLKIEGATLEKMYYMPAVDRKKGTQLELIVNIPAHSTVDLTYDFEKAILRYTEYPPDANRGFDIAPAILRILPGSNSEHDEGNYLRTTSLLLPLPTPDFSMPYNVIILTSTVIALGFGSIFNLLIRQFVLLEEVPKSPLAGVLKKVGSKLRELKRKPALSESIKTVANDQNAGSQRMESKDRGTHNQERPQQDKLYGSVNS